MIEDFERKLKLVIEFYKSFRTHAEQRRNFLRMVKEGKFTQESMNPSYEVELEHLEKLIGDSNELFPTVYPLQEFEKEALKEHAN